MSETAGRADLNTIADYEAFIASQPDNTRWELVAGVIVMMTNPTGNHGQITMNVAMPLKAAMDPAGCRTYAGSMRVQSSEQRSAGDATVPDIVVHCGPDRNRTFITDPVVIVEVLSRSTFDLDRGLKLIFHKSLTTLQHIALIYQDQMRIEHYFRGEDGWIVDVITKPSDRLFFSRIGVSVDLDAIYFDVPVLRPVEGPDLIEVEPPTPVR